MGEVLPSHLTMPKRTRESIKETGAISRDLLYTKYLRRRAKRIQEITENKCMGKKRYREEEGGSEP